jgi:uncharacterized damage-inducible protein DinB
MPLNQSFRDEMQQEAAKTRTMLERLPIEKNDWKPHEKSMNLGRLATHIAELPGWVYMIMATDELDFAKFDYKPVMAESTKDLLDKHDEGVSQAISILETSKEEDFEKMWTMRRGDHVFFTMPKAAVLRSFAYSHLFHHRGQLSVYLRLLDIPIPGMYGPSADEMPAPAEMESSNN